MDSAKHNTKSVKISDCKEYLFILLKGSFFQAKGLLLFANNREIRCIISILKAIQTLPVSNVTKKLLSKRNTKAIILALVSSVSNKSKQRNIIKTFHKQILILLRSVKNRLLPYLK